MPKTPTPRKKKPTLFARLSAGPRRGARLPEAELKKRLTFMVLMCTHADLFLATFPARGGVSTTALEEAGFFKKGELPAERLEEMAANRSTLLLVQLLWQNFGEYTDPPCPRRETFEKLVRFMRDEL